MIRGCSERAALYLFMAANLIASLETAELSWTKETALELIMDAERDIENCWTGQEHVGTHNIRYLERLQRQYVPNAAAAGVLRYLAVQTLGGSDPQRASRVSRIRSFLKENEKLLPLLRAELSLFLILAGDTDVGTRQVLKEAVGGKQVAPLALDRWLLTEIGRAARPLLNGPVT
jgi:hypothetical protein